MSRVLLVSTLKWQSPPVPPRKPSNRYHHGDLRAALMDAALAQIRAGGVHGLSLRACARALGVSHAAPYRHFADREALLGAIAGQGYEWLAASGRAAMVGLDDPHERLEAYGVAYVRFAHEHPEHHRVMFASELDASCLTAPDREASDQAFALLLELARDVVGDRRDPLEAALAYWSLVHGLAMLLIDGRIPAEHLEGEGAVERLARSVLDYWQHPG